MEKLKRYKVDENCYGQILTGDDDWVKLSDGDVRVCLSSDVEQLEKENAHLRLKVTCLENDVVDCNEQMDRIGELLRKIYDVDFARKNPDFVRFCGSSVDSTISELIEGAMLIHNQ
jgi:hypothetical protein